jgi:hypothetical protein
MSPTWRVLGACAVKSRSSRSGTGAAEGSGIVVRTFLRRCTPVIPSVRIILPSFLWLTRCSALRSAAAIRGRP